ncbi:S1 RNA-binding domain-containing protein [Streptomyces sp. NPDC056773]|uniref:S1 RNA-binding domain-containing protein n=1 Tax=Streptomyces sp. NPDC056773 TaxID=3345941 RepID=UPI00369106B3
MINRLQPGPVRRARVVGFDGPDVLVSLADPQEQHSEVGRIPAQEVSLGRRVHPSQIFELGQEIEAEEIGRWRGGQLHLSARSCENPALRSFLLGMQPGKIVTGTVAAVHNFGVFVHLDGEPEDLCTGFIRVPDLTWSWIEHPSKVAHPGQRITAEVIVFDTRQGQVTVSLKALLEDPLVRFADRVGQVLSGPVTKIVPFGVFVRLADGVEGLLHLSELTKEPTETPDQIVSEGELITVRVAEVDLERRRVALHAAAADEGV